eukprot:Nk52_evm1s343 gene=Nk52_evmTU1s343
MLGEWCWKIWYCVVDLSPTIILFWLLLIDGVPEWLGSRALLFPLYTILVRGHKLSFGESLFRGVTASLGLIISSLTMALSAYAFGYNDLNWLSLFVFGAFAFVVGYIQILLPNMIIFSFGSLVGSLLFVCEIHKLESNEDLIALIQTSLLTSTSPMLSFLLSAIAWRKTSSFLLRGRISLLLHEIRDFQKCVFVYIIEPFPTIESLNELQQKQKLCEESIKACRTNLAFSYWEPFLGRKKLAYLERGVEVCGRLTEQLGKMNMHLCNIELWERYATEHKEFIGVVQPELNLLVSLCDDLIDDITDLHGQQSHEAKDKHDAKIHLLPTAFKSPLLVKFKEQLGCERSSNGWEFVSKESFFVASAKKYCEELIESFNSLCARKAHTNETSCATTFSSIVNVAEGLTKAILINNLFLSSDAKFLVPKHLFLSFDRIAFEFGIKTAIVMVFFAIFSFIPAVMSTFDWWIADNVGIVLTFVHVPSDFSVIKKGFLRIVAAFLGCSLAVAVYMMSLTNKYALASLAFLIDILFALLDVYGKEYNYVGKAGSFSFFIVLISKWLSVSDPQSQSAWLLGVYLFADNVAAVVILLIVMVVHPYGDKSLLEDGLSSLLNCCGQYYNLNIAIMQMEERQQGERDGVAKELEIVECAMLATKKRIEVINIPNMKILSFMNIRAIDIQSYQTILKRIWMFKTYARDQRLLMKSHFREKMDQKFWLKTNGIRKELLSVSLSFTQLLSTSLHITRPLPFDAHSPSEVRRRFFSQFNMLCPFLLAKDTDYDAVTNYLCYTFSTLCMTTELDKIAELVDELNEQYSPSRVFRNRDYSRLFPLTSQGH